MDGKVQVVLPNDSKPSAESILKASSEPQQHLRQAITMLVSCANSGTKVADYAFYKQVMKPQIQEFNPVFYNKILERDSHCSCQYGVTIRKNTANQIQIQKDPDAFTSIFDSDAFLFYLLKYSEILGVDSLIQFSSHDRTMSYEQKWRIVDFIIRTERELGVSESSWKHCLLYLFMHGRLTEAEFRSQFKFD